MTTKTLTFNMQVFQLAGKAYKDAISFGYKKKYEDLVLISPSSSYWFAKDIPGANIQRLQVAASKDSYYAYRFAVSIPGADIEFLEKSMGRYLKIFHNEIVRDIIE